ncbi:hypothetical protein EII19_13320 [Comamonadaceae bacterium OH2310_COT-174]|nr:hypothetical protein EII19_13320 [Comamonadaceae bacterium OH2310_COT-174]
MNSSTTFTVSMSQSQLYELSDAACEVIERMLREGISEEEAKLNSLSELWEAYKTLHLTLLGSIDTPAIRRLEQQVTDALDSYA